METAAATGGGETGARGAGRSHGETEMVAEAGGSEGGPVKLCVTNVYNSSSSEIVNLETTNTIGDLKRLLQETVTGRPMPHQQRLIFRGKQCDESQQLGHVLRGLDLSGQHNIHLIVAPNAGQKIANESISNSNSNSGATVDRTGGAESLTLPHQEPSNPRPPLPGNSNSSSNGGSGDATAATPSGPAATPLAARAAVAAAAAAAAATNERPERIQLSQSQVGQLQRQYLLASTPAAATAATAGRPERFQLSQMQLGSLQRQYQGGLREHERVLAEHRQRFNFLLAQSRALTQQQQQQQRRASSTTYRLHPTSAEPQQQQEERSHILQQDPQQVSLEVATRAATRALGGNMPGPAGGGAVRDVTAPPPEGHIPAAGLGEDGDAGRGNLVDPPPNAPDVGREARGWFKMVLQCMGVIVVFGIDANPSLLLLLALGGLVTFLFRTGLLKEMLGSRREGGGLWKKLCTGATVITEGDGRLMDARYLCSTFFFSLFPKWQPVRSPEAIAAEAAAAEAQAAAEEETRRIRQVIARAEQAVDQAEQFLRETAAAAADGGDGNEDAAAEQVADANPPPNVD